MLVASYVLSYKAKKFTYFKRTIYSRITRALSITGWVGLLWMFVRYEGAAYLNWRFWPLLVFIYLLFEAYYLWRFIKKEWPKRLAQGAKDDKKEKYLKEFKKRSRK